MSYWYAKAVWVEYGRYGEEVVVLDCWTSESSVIGRPLSTQRRQLTTGDCRARI